MAALHVETATEIARPAAAVFAYVEDVTNNPSFQRGMRSCVWTSPPPIGLGSTYEQVAAFLGRMIVSKFKVDEYEPGRRIRFRSTAGPFPIVERRTVVPISASACRVEVVLDGDASGFYRWVAPFLGPLVGRSVKADYSRLKAVLETREG